MLPVPLSSPQYRISKKVERVCTIAKPVADHVDSQPTQEDTRKYVKTLLSSNFQQINSGWLLCPALLNSPDARKTVKKNRWSHWHGHTDHGGLTISSSPTDGGCEQNSQKTRIICELQQLPSLSKNSGIFTFLWETMISAPDSPIMGSIETKYCYKMLEFPWPF